MKGLLPLLFSLIFTFPAQAADEVEALQDTAQRAKITGEIVELRTSEDGEQYEIIMSRAEEKFTHTLSTEIPAAKLFKVRTKLKKGDLLFQRKEKSGVDAAINETVGPYADAISGFIFTAIPIKAPEEAETPGQVVEITKLNQDQNRIVVEGAAGRKEYEVPGFKGGKVEIGQEIQEGTNLTGPLIEVPFVVVWLILGAVIFTLAFRFVNFRKFKFAIDVVRGRYTDPNEAGEVSHFQALATALSATVGLGNIAGVAIAISLGGPGAMLWMVIAGLLGMSTKFVECTLGVKYREIDENGVVHGGPMFYLSRGLKERNMGGLGKILAVFFAICCIGASFGGGNMFQVNQAYSQFSGMLPGETAEGYGWVFGGFMAILVGVVIIGGIKSIARVTERIVPFMAVFYVLAALFILVVHYQQIPGAIAAVFNGAFGGDAIYGGIVGVLIVGFQRAAFSNEAGIGSAPIAHSAVKTENPASEGLVALLEPFIDTVVVCTMTALVIIITENYHYQESVAGVTLTSMSFKSVIPWFDNLLGIAVILFAFSTMISWSYYGQQAWMYLFGKSRLAELAYKALFLVFIILGAGMTLSKVFPISDAMIFAMCFPNIIGLYILMPEVRKSLSEYTNKINSGEIIKRN